MLGKARRASLTAATPDAARSLHPGGRHSNTGLRAVPILMWLLLLPCVLLPSSHSHTACISVHCAAAQDLPGVPTALPMFLPQRLPEALPNTPKADFSMMKRKATDPLVGGVSVR
jgi:hypothetical protein